MHLINIPRSEKISKLLSEHQTHVSNIPTFHSFMQNEQIRTEFESSIFDTPVILGSSYSSPVIHDLAHSTNLLIFGKTGVGKSFYAFSLLYQLSKTTDFSDTELIYSTRQTLHFQNIFKDNPNMFANYVKFINFSDDVNDTSFIDSLEAEVELRQAFLRNVSKTWKELRSTDPELLKLKVYFLDEAEFLFYNSHSRFREVFKKSLTLGLRFVVIAHSSKIAGTVDTLFNLSHYDERVFYIAVGIKSLPINFDSPNTDIYLNGVQASSMLVTSFDYTHLT